MEHKQVPLEDGYLYLHLRNMSHTIYAAKFDQTISHQHAQAPVHVLMRLYPIFPLKTTENILISVISLMKIQKYFNRESVFLNE
jgi:hypothetical protein